MVQLTITHPISLASLSRQPDSFYTLDGSLFHQSVSSSVINTTLRSLLFAELPVDIRSPCPTLALAHPTSLYSFSLLTDSIYPVNVSFFYPSVYFSVVHTTLYSLSFDELQVSINPSMSITSFGF